MRASSRPDLTQSDKSQADTNHKSRQPQLLPSTQHRCSRSLVVVWQVQLRWESQGRALVPQHGVYEQSTQHEVKVSAKSSGHVAPRCSSMHFSADAPDPVWYVPASQQRQALDAFIPVSTMTKHSITADSYAHDLPRCTIAFSGKLLPARVGSQNAPASR